MTDRYAWARAAVANHKGGARERKGAAILRKILAFVAVVEVGTGLLALIDPAIVVSLLAGAHEPEGAAWRGRIAGFALLALGLACWQSLRRAASGAPAFCETLTYNVLIGSYFAYLGTGGWPLWPGVALHAVAAQLLVP